jgi:hypothetical protein
MVGIPRDSERSQNFNREFLDVCLFLNAKMNLSNDFRICF